MISIYNKYRTEILASFICLGSGMASGFFARTGDSAWYIHLIKPSFSPPNWIFGPVWTVLYIMMGIAFGKLVLDRKNNSTLIILFITQFIFNLLWTPFFFYSNNLQLALFDIILLWINLLIFMIVSKNKPIIFLLFLPYIMWVSFALILTFSLYQLNS
jgi:tryptophan-rich sensory protein